MGGAAHLMGAYCLGQAQVVQAPRRACTRFTTSKPRPTTTPAIGWVTAPTMIPSISGIEMAHGDSFMAR